MRVLLLFLALFVPAFALLAVAGEKNLRRDLPSSEPTMKRTPLIDAKDLTGADGEPPPLRGIVWKLDEMLMRTVESGYVKVAVELGELARDKRGPHFKRLRARYYNQPDPDKDPVLIYLVESPRLDGDPGALPGTSGERILTMPHGVSVSDGQNRPLFKSGDVVQFRLRERTVDAKGAAEIWYPERGVKIRGVGVTAAFPEDGDESGAVEKNVVATAPWKNGTLTLRTPGPLAAKREGEEIQIDASNGGTIETGEGKHTFTSATVTLKEREPATSDADDEELIEPERFELVGPWEYRPNDPATLQGLEFLQAGDGYWSGDWFEAGGTVKTVRRGPFELFGDGERRIRLEAGGASGRTSVNRDGGKREFASLHLFDGVAAFDLADGAVGRFEARTATVRPDSLRAAGDVKLRSDRLNVDGDKLAATWDEEKNLSARLTGKKKVWIPVREQAGGREGTAVFTNTGPLTLTVRGDRRKVVATDAVLARFLAAGDDAATDPPTLKCGSMELTDKEAGNGEPGESRIVALDGFVLTEPSRGFTASGETLQFDRYNRRGRTRGAPGSKAAVRVNDDEGRTQAVDADEIAFDITVRTFATSGRTVALLELDKGRWRIECDKSDGQWSEDKKPVALQLVGGVFAVGPENEELRGDRVVYDGIAQTMTVCGSPAVLRRGDALTISYDEIEVQLKDGRFARGMGRGKGTVDVRNTNAQDAAGIETSKVARWLAKLDGDTVFENNRVVIPNGGEFTGVNVSGQPVLTGRAGRIEIDIVEGKSAAGPEWEPQRLHATNGVHLEGTTDKGPVKVTADELSYDWKTRRVILLGNVRIDGEGYGAVGVLQRAEVLLTDDGVKIQRIKELSARKKR
ncbi:MAG: hypothetical protein V3T86_09850 [Planctomycetota bacterium]